MKFSVLLSLALIAGGCERASLPSSPTGTSEAHGLFSSAPFGMLILSGTATAAHVGEYTTITVRVDPSVGSMRWTFGDGTTSALFRTTMPHYYQAAGTYQATLTVTTFGGASETASGDIGVLPPLAPAPPTPVPQPPAPSFGVNLAAFSTVRGTPTTFQITLSGATANDITAASMQYGDGNSEAITSATPTHTYASAGMYIATVMVTNTAGSRRSATTTAVVNDGSPSPGSPHLTLAVYVNPAPAGSATLITIGVDAVATPLPTLYEVDCENDGVFDVSSAGNALQCTYAVAGTYTAKVRATNGIVTSTALSDPFVVP